MFLTLAALGLAFCAGAQRIVRSVNDSWLFSKEGEDVCETVGLPHTWNAADSEDEKDGYWRGRGIYVRNIRIDGGTEDRSFYLHFEGANQVTEVYVNGSRAGGHVGGYSAFCIDVSDFVHQGDNELKVIVDNSHDKDVPPLSADFTFFGGIYRDVSLIVTPKVHVSTTHYGTSGVYVDTFDEDTDNAGVRIRTFVSNGGDRPSGMVLRHRIWSPDGNLAAETERRLRLAAGERNRCVETVLEVGRPQLWDIGDGRTYRVETFVEADGACDVVSVPFGFRWYSFDPREGFFLNGRHVKLVGTSRHQDYHHKGNALSDHMHIADVRLLKELGGNFLRIAHYPQDALVAGECDRLGIVASVEIPVVNAVTMSEEFRRNCLEMTREMIWQNYNNPSVIIWAYMNEVLLRPPYDKEDAAAKKEYMEWLCSLASDIEKLTDELDAERYTMLPCHSNPGIYEEAGLTALPDLLGWNLYNGWYSNRLEGFGQTLDKLRERFPEKGLIVSEYGADMDPRLHSFTPERFDYTCEYGLEYHRHYIKEIMSRKDVAGACVWNLNDFYSEGRTSSVPRVNNKGLTGLDRERKDVCHLYEAWLREDAVLRIGGSEWKNRSGAADSSGCCVHPVAVFGNVGEVSLAVNGRQLGTKEFADCMAEFDVPFTDGENVLVARTVKDGVELTDMVRVNFDAVPSDVSEFVSLNVMLGTERYFEDREEGVCWMPEKEYVPGSWGYVGGEAFRAKTKSGSLPYHQVDVLGTDKDPLFQTQRMGLDAFRADVPDGRYHVYLYFAELASGIQREALAYNLGNDAVAESSSSRLFDVLVNGAKVMERYDILSEAGPERAVIKRFTVDVTDGAGLDIRFVPQKGETILNAIRIYKCH